MSRTAPCVGLLLACAFFVAVKATHGASLRLIGTIPLPDVQGRLDHLAIDLAGNRLFVCALGNNTVEVIDLEKAERVHSITGLANPQGVAYAQDLRRIFVSNAEGGACNIYDGKTFALLGRVEFKDDADNVRYDASTLRIYVGYGDGGIGVIDARTGKSANSIDLLGHPEAFVLEKEGRRIFANVPRAGQVAVLDRDKGKVTGVWKVDGAAANFPLALDEANHRLFVGCRSPAKLLVLNTDSGDVVTSIAISGDMDDVFYNPARHCLYAICGDGRIDLIDQVDRDSYRVTAHIDTAIGARTGLFVPELNSLFVAVPAHGRQGGEIRRFAIE